jgi:uncharacterized protein (TIGR02284 family)
MATQHPSEAETARALNALIEINTDAAKGYAIAAADARSPVLKGILGDRARQSEDRVMALQNAVLRMGRFAENQGTLKGTLHRGWLDARLAIEGRTDRIVLEECERGEAAALRGYEAIATEVLQALAPDVVGMVEDQRCELRAAHDDTARRLRELAGEAAARG